MISKEVHEEISLLCSDIVHKIFQLSDIKDEKIIIDASADKAVVKALLTYKETHNILLNVVDVPDLCDFYFMALTKNRPLQIAVSSNGASPIAAQHFRDECEALIPQNITQYLEEKQKQRENGIINPKTTKQELTDFKTKVYLVGCGLGDPDLLTLKAYKIICRVDVVLYDNLISDEIMALVPQKTLKVYVGKEKGKHSKSQDEINESILAYIAQGYTVARLKSGDPYVFGRGAEEMKILTQLAIPTEVIPGISSSISGTLFGDIPITARDYASSFSVVSPHTKGDNLNLTWMDLLKREKHTVVVLMGLSKIKEIVKESQRLGIEKSSPCAIISKASRAEQNVAICTLETLVEASRDMSRPSILVFGDVVNYMQNI